MVLVGMYRLGLLEELVEHWKPYNSKSIGFPDDVFTSL